MDLVKDCIANSTVRGFNKITGAKQERIPELRAVWVVFILVFTVLALLSVAYIIKDYNSSPVVTVQEEFVYFKNEKESEKHVRRHFPAVTVCNANPLSSRAFNQTQFLSYTEYLRLVHNVTELLNSTHTHRKVYVKELIDAQIVESLESLYGYFSNIGLENATKLGHRFEEFVISCELLVRRYFVSVPCQGFVYTTRIESPNFFNCYLIGFKSTSSQLKEVGIPRGFTLTLYTGEIEYAFPNPYPHGRNDFQLDNGILLALQAPGKYPDLQSNAYRLAPGFHHHIAFSAQSRRRLQKPYAGPDCRDTDPWSALNYKVEDYTNVTGAVPWQELEPPLWDLSGQGFSYSHDGQVNSCINKALLKNCQCLDPDFPTVHKKEWLAGVPFCADLSAGGIHETILRLLCMHQHEHEQVARCANTSKLECTQTIISSDLSGYAWPRDLEQLSFYDKHINKQPFDQHFKAFYQDVRNLLDNQNVAEAKKKLLSYNPIKQNFLKVTIEERSYVSSKVEDVPKWSLTTLLGQVGGNLNLWAGISIVVLVELLVLGIKLLIKCHKNRKRSEEREGIRYRLQSHQGQQSDEE